MLANPAERISCKSSSAVCRISFGRRDIAPVFTLETEAELSQQFAAAGEQSRENVRAPAPPVSGQRH